MLVLSVKYLLLAVAFTPLIVTLSTIYPFILGKLIFFRSLTAITAVVFIFLLSQDSRIRRKFITVVKNPLIILVFLFIIWGGIGVFFAKNPLVAFWGNLERGEGWLTWLHIFLFLLMAVTIFERKDWIQFVRLSVIASIIVSFYGTLQFLGVKSFPGAFKLEKLTSFFGNSSILAAYFTLIVGFALWLLNVDINRFWKSAAAVAILWSSAMIVLSGTRGAILALVAGLFLGVLLLAWRHKFYRVLLVIFILFGIGFLLTKQHPIWQKVPLFDSLASLSLEHPTVKTRLIALGVSWRAFKEKPIIGWGIDNYRVAYNKHYNPDYALYEAAWFDRAHNKIMDILVMNGGVGLILYLSILGLVIWYLRQMYLKGEKKESLALGFLLIIYFIQNLFLFDHLVTYILFFALLGIIAQYRNSLVVVDNSLPTSSLTNASPLAISLGSTAILLIPLVIYYIYAYNYIPYRQAKTYWYARNNIPEVNQLNKTADEFLYPYNFAQSTIRKSYHDYLVNKDVFANKNPHFMALGDKALSALEEVVKKEPDDPRNLIRLSEAYIDRAEKIDKSYFAKAEQVLRKAIELSPKRQEPYYHLAYTLLGAGKKEEALATAQAALDLQPEVARAHYIKGLILSLMDQRDEGEKEIEKALTMKKGSFFLEADKKNIAYIYTNNFIRYARKRDLAGLRRAAKRIRQFKPEVADAVDKLLNLAEQGRWNELNAVLDSVLGDQ